MNSLLTYFTDPVLRAPMIGSMLMCIAASLIGVVVFLRRQSLIGEALSHAAYPGVVVGVTFVGALFGDITTGDAIGFAMLSGAFISALVGMKLIRWLENSLKVSADAALCFVLSFFFGLGVTLASHIQFSFSNLFRQVQIYFFGQAATMTDFHIFLYATLVAVIFLALIFLRKELKTLIFDPRYAKLLGINIPFLETTLLLLIVLSIVIGIRSVGVVLMSAMLIAPAAAARQYTHSLGKMFALSAIFGLFSACFGTYFANEGSIWLSNVFPGTRLNLATGPLIVLVATAICLFALLFSPERGVFIRFFRILRFRRGCLDENILKALWRQGSEPFDCKKLQEIVNVPRLYLSWALYRLSKKGAVEKLQNGRYHLTPTGGLKAQKIVRLHRLWELYLSDYVGIGPQRVHSSADEMEHILTPELELKLTELLQHPALDPHYQPIPPI